MSNISLSLSKINEAVEETFGDFTINMAPEGEPEDVIAFRYFLRAPKEARAKLATAYERIAGKGEDTDEAGELLLVLQEALEAVAVKPAHYVKLKKALGDDLVMWTYVVAQYGDRYSQAGQTPEA